MISRFTTRSDVANTIHPQKVTANEQQVDCDGARASAAAAVRGTMKKCHKCPNHKRSQSRHVAKKTEEGRRKKVPKTERDG